MSYIFLLLSMTCFFPFTVYGSRTTGITTSHYIALGNTPKRWLGKWIISKLDLSPFVVSWTAMNVSSWSSLGYQIFVTSPTLRWNFQSRPGRTRHRTVGSSARSKSSDFTCGFYRGDEAETPSLTWKGEKLSMSHRIHMYGIFTYTFTIKINQMEVNIPVPWILWGAFVHRWFLKPTVAFFRRASMQSSRGISKITSPCEWGDIGKPGN